MPALWPLSAGSSQRLSWGTSPCNNAERSKQECDGHGTANHDNLSQKHPDQWDPHSSEWDLLKTEDSKVALARVRHRETGEAVCADSEELCGCQCGAEPLTSIRSFTS